MGKYEDEKALLRIQRKELRDKATKLSIEIEECLNKFRNDEGEELINVEDFKDLTIGKKYAINDKVFFIPVSYKPCKWVFETYLEAGGYYGIHKHNAVELCDIKYGNLVDALTGRQYGSGEIARFEKGQRHKPGATLPSKYIVTFLID